MSFQTAVAWPVLVLPTDDALFGIAEPPAATPGHARAADGAHEPNAGSSSAAPAGDAGAASAILASPVPEPGTMSLILAGVAVMGWLGRRRGR